MGIVQWAGANPANVLVHEYGTTLTYDIGMSESLLLVNAKENIHLPSAQ